VCDKCGNQFTEKRNLTRHMTTHYQSSQTYSCDICVNEFSRPDNKKHHQESHDYAITCPVSSRYFNRRYHSSPVSTFLNINPNDRLMVNAVVCCVKIRRTISGKVDAAISFKVKCPDTKWVVHLLTNVTFYVNKLFDHPIGARVVLPDHILKNKAVVGLVTGSNRPYTDNLCFFRCNRTSIYVPLLISLVFLLTPLQLNLSSAPKQK
jgi:hypothetical protein